MQQGNLPMTRYTPEHKALILKILAAYDTTATSPEPPGLPMYRNAPCASGVNSFRVQHPATKKGNPMNNQSQNC
jgi:hypothetical protein